MIKFIATNCVNIKELSLSSCNFKDVEGLDEIKNLKYLYNLNLYRTLIKFEQLKEILIECKQLRYLNLGSCTEIEDFEPVMELIGEYLPEIESLDLWRAYGLTHEGLAKLANKCFNIKYIDIGWW
jgi:F-box/leucine-rich repeat protein 4